MFLQLPSLTFPLMLYIEEGRSVSWFTPQNFIAPKLPLVPPPLPPHFLMLFYQPRLWHIMYEITPSCTFIQLGAKEWANLSEKERQARLIKLRLQERKLRQEGKFDEASALLGDAAKNQAALAALMGKTRKSQEEQMRERLERRRQRMASGEKL